MSEQIPGMQVLIVDDDPVMGELLDALLTVEGYRVTRAHSGEEALQVAREGTPKPDIILCDIQMPGMRGGQLATTLAAARAVGSLPATTVILAMSGSSPHAEELRSFDGLLRKPFSVTDFAQAVDQARRQTAVRTAAGSEPSFDNDNSARVPPLDDRIFEQLKSKVGNDLLRQMYDMTLADVRDRLERIAEAAERGDESVIRHEAHTIKGSCGMMGALELQSLAAATEGGSPVDTSALANFDSACKRLQSMLNERLKPDDQAPGEHTDDAHTRTA
jgi:CheY-like chemotaxis protein/HPt (histidine-containing phosphotransfer) domain-containing protein